MYIYIYRILQALETGWGPTTPCGPGFPLLPGTLVCSSGSVVPFVACELHLGGILECAIDVTFFQFWGSGLHSLCSPNLIFMFLPSLDPVSGSPPPGVAVGVCVLFSLYQVPHLFWGLIGGPSCDPLASRSVFAEAYSAEAKRGSLALSTVSSHSLNSLAF